MIHTQIPQDIDDDTAAATTWHFQLHLHCIVYATGYGCSCMPHASILIMFKGRSARQCPFTCGAMVKSMSWNNTIHSFSVTRYHKIPQTILIMWDSGRQASQWNYELCYRLLVRESYIIFFPPGICDSGRNALTDISRRFVIWWWSIWKWLIIWRCLVLVSGCLVLVPPRPWRVVVALRGLVAHGQNLCVPGSWNKADACLAFRVPWWCLGVLHDVVFVDLPNCTEL